jgi:predicted HTH domain antitoxin
MSPLTIEIPEDILAATGQSPEEFVREAKLLLALGLFERGRLSSGKAGQLCGLGRVDFLLAASRQGIPVADLEEHEMAKEFDVA